MRAVKPRAATPPTILTAFEAAPLDFDEVLADALGVDEEEVEEGLVVGDVAVDVAGGIEEVRVTPAAAQDCWAMLSDVASSLALHLASKHWVVETMKALFLHKHSTSPTRQLPRSATAKQSSAHCG